MGMNFDDEQLMTSLLKFVTGMPVQFQLVDLYGNKKPSQLFETTTTTTTSVHHVFTQLKRKTKNFIRGIIGGGGSWKGVDNSRPVYDKKRSLIGFKKTFRFNENNHVWNMKEYRLCDNILKALRVRGHTRHEGEFVVCRITRSINVENFVPSCVPVSSPQHQENQDLGESRVIPSDELKINQDLGESRFGKIKIWENPESNPASAKKEECSARPDYDIATYHKQLDAYAASLLKTMVPYIPKPPQEDEADSIPLFSEDFYIGYTNLWS